MQIEDDQRSEEDMEFTGEHVRMWERRRTPVHSELDFFMDNCAITQVGPVDQQACREKDDGRGQVDGDRTGQRQR